MTSIRLLKINYKTNIKGYKDTYRVYSPLNTDPSPTMQNRVRQVGSYLPDNTLFFIDTAELTPKDFNNSSEMVLNKLMDDDLFESLLKKKFDENKKKHFGKFIPTSVQDADDLQIIHHNIIVILNLLFQQRKVFYLNNRPFTIKNYIWNPMVYNTQNNIQFNGVPFNIHEVFVVLTLDERRPDQISDVEYKKSDCFNKKEVIKQNFNRVFGDGNYTVKTPKGVSAITRAPSMLPNPGSVNNPVPPTVPLRRSPIGYVPVYNMPGQIPAVQTAGSRTRRHRKCVKRNRTINRYRG